MKDAKTCASLQPKFCKEEWCVLGCDELQFNGLPENKRNQCEGKCQACCLSVGPTSWVMAITGDDLDLIKAHPSCKAYSDLSVEYLGEDYRNYPPPLWGYYAWPGTEESEYCREQCEDICEGQVDDCLVTCKPCCQGLVENQCYPEYSFEEEIRVPQCKKFKENYPDAYNSLCFPADATVMCQGGHSICMDELKIGDKVAIMYNDGTFGFEDVYQFGHQDENVLGLSYIRVSVSADDGKEFELTLAVPIHKDDVKGTELVTAKDIHNGSTVLVWDAEANALVKAIIQYKTHVMARGAYNPYTLQGNIIVNGVVTSSHNDWAFAEKLIPLAFKSYLPSIYNGMLAINRLGYKFFGANAWAAINQKIDMTAPHVRKSIGNAVVSAAVYVYSTVVASDSHELLKA